jgi:hypothetical protein
MQNKLKTEITQTGNLTTTSGNQTMVFLPGSQSLSVKVDQLAGSDGEQANVQSISIQSTVWAYAHFHAYPVIIQTGGSITPGLKSTEYTLNEILDGCIDDDFGFQVIGKMKSSVATNQFYDGSSVRLNHRIIFNIDIPKKFLTILNRDTQTERLRHLTLVIIVQGTTGIIHYNCTHFEMRYLHSAKPVQIR